MKKIILIAGIIAIGFASCTQVNSTGEKVVTKGTDTVSEVDISLSKYDAINELAEIEEPQELLFRASGTEPGWLAEFYNNKLRLVVDYGKDSLIMEDQKFDDLDDEDGFVFDENSKKLNVRINNVSCIAPGSGNKEDRTVQVTFKGRSYKGCGSFVK